MDRQEPTVVVGLRIDVDTLRGTRLGVPALLKLLDAHGIRASFFFSVGPDNMGRHLWRLIRPVCLLKMIRSKAASLYGWDILLRGVFWPGPDIGRKCGFLMKAAAEHGHEIGIHAWDHHKWQTKLGKMTKAELQQEVDRGVSTLSEILGSNLVCSASAGWRCNEAVLSQKENYDMEYHSDCRGTSIFRPLVKGAPATPQIPVTLPTYDEMVGRDGISDENYNAALLRMVDPQRLNVLTIHAEVEGIAKSKLFEEFLNEAKRRSIAFVPLGELLPDAADIEVGAVAEQRIAGRDGPVCVQAA